MYLRRNRTPHKQNDIGAPLLSGFDDVSSDGSSDNAMENRGYQVDEEYGADKNGRARDMSITDNKTEDFEDPPITLKSIGQNFPRRVLLIFGNEFCERFAFYGLRTILVIYLTRYLMMSDTNAIEINHGFTVMCYWTPIIGSILADGYIGKFKTILYLSLIYAAGMVLIAVISAVGATSSVHPYIDIVALFVLVGLGTGGIKPNVASFGGEQFKNHQTFLLPIYFSVFYFCINAGSLISTLLTPELRTMKCLGQDTCYPLAFGIPAILMLVATVVFLAGSFTYDKYPPKDNIIAEVCKLIGSGAYRRFSNRSVKREHWLEHALDNHSCATEERCSGNVCHKAKLVEDVKAVIHVAVLYVPVPVFWSCFDQQSSRWVLQATNMSGRVGSATILPDQMQFVNALLILVFIPIANVIYNVLNKFVRVTPLRKMGTGGLIAVIAYIICIFIQLRVNKDLVNPPKGDDSRVFILNYGAEDGCTYNFTYMDVGTGESMELGVVPAGNMTEFEHPFPDNATIHGVAIRGECEKKGETITWADQGFSSGNVYYAAVYRNLQSQDFVNIELVKTDQGGYKASFEVLAPGFCDSDGVCPAENATVVLCDVKEGTHGFNCLKDAPTDDGMDTFKYEYKDGGKDKKMKVRYVRVAPSTVADVGDHTYYVHAKNNEHTISATKPLNIDSVGGIYSFALTCEQETCDTAVLQDHTEYAKPNSFSILWQLPQIAVMTAAEVLFSITGLEFSFSQAPTSMKSVIQSLWLLMVALGNLIILILALIEFSNEVFNYILFAALMFVAMLIFIFTSTRYKYVSYSREDEDE